MSIATAIQNAKTKIEAAYSACDGKGATMDYATFAEKSAQIGIDIVMEFIKGL